MVDQKKDKKEGQQSGNRGFDDPNQQPGKHAAPKDDKQVKKASQDDEDDYKQGNKQSPGRQSQSGQPNQEGLRTKGRDDDEGLRGTKSRNGSQSDR